MRTIWTIALATLLAATGPGPAAAQSTWSSYVDSRFGTRIDYPSDLFTDLSLGEEGAVFEGAGARLQVSAAEQHVRGPADLRDRMAETPGYEDVTYSPEGRNWLVVSGYRGDLVFYEKYFIVDGTVQGFVLEYPEADRDLFDPIVEALEDSFAPGRGVAAAAPGHFEDDGGFEDYVDSAREDRRAAQRQRQAEHRAAQRERQAERRAERERRRMEREFDRDGYVACEPRDLRCLRGAPPRG
jgi:hypothetical protein